MVVKILVCVYYIYSNAILINSILLHDEKIRTN